jgi:hypothetical protein
MNQLHALIAAAALALAASAHAHDCSGGNDGGMDATGNQCNQPAPAVAVVQTPGKSLAARPANAAARPAKTSVRAPNKTDRLARVTIPQGR